MKQFLFVALALISLGMFLTDVDYEYIQYGDAQIAYDSSTVPVEVAERAHQFLIMSGGYDNKSGDILLLEKNNVGTWVAKFPVFTGAETNPRVIGSFKLLGGQIKSRVFNNEVFELHLADSSFNTVRILDI